MGDDTQLVGDEQDGEVQLGAELVQQVEDLGLDGHVQGADRLVRDEHPWLERQGPCDGHPLPLAAGQVARQPRRDGRGQSHEVEHPAHERIHAGPVDEACAPGRAPRWCPGCGPAGRARSTGPGRPAACCAGSRRGPCRALRARPVRRTRRCPNPGRTSRTRQRARVVLPLPDSPTMPRMRPGASAMDTSSSAVSRGADRRRATSPALRRPGKCLVRLVATRMGAASALESVVHRTPTLGVGERTCAEMPVVAHAPAPCRRRRRHP